MATIDTKRTRKSVIITDRLCEKHVTERVKFYDAKCPGFYISIIPPCVATFSFRFTDPAAGKQRTVLLGLYNRDSFNVEQARAAAYARKGMDPATLVEQLNQGNAARGKHGKTVAELIQLRIDWMKKNKAKPDADGVFRPNIGDWPNVARHLNKFVLPRFGRKIASDLNRYDIATLSDDIMAGKFGVPSVSNARHVRRAVSGMYNWAALPSNNYVPETCQPCLRLEELPTELPADRVLSADEIRTFWNGCERTDLPYDRKTILALKFELVSMLRGGQELREARREELFDLDDPGLARFDVPLGRTKKRRPIKQPLNSLAVEIVNEALARDDQMLVFESPVYPGQPIHRHAPATALRGRPDKGTPGLCELFGLKAFTPHDLRRTAATLLGDLGYSNAEIAKCLNHERAKAEGNVPTVTGKVYNRSEYMVQKRKMLDALDAELRRIIGLPAAAPKLKLVA
jgi:integrase